MKDTLNAKAALWKQTLWRMFMALLAVFLIAGLKAVPVSADEEELPDNGIPVVILDIDESQGTVDAMHSSPFHTNYCYGTISIFVPEGFHYSDFPDADLKDLEGIGMSVRGRGNSTWRVSTRRPYKVKLDSKENVLGLGKSKHWVLIANEFDETLLRDRITAWIGDEMGFEFTPRGVPVDLVMKGSEFGTHYMGSYYLSENVRVGSERLDIDELEENDTDLPVISGGYLVQQGSQVADESPDKFYSLRGTSWATHTPSFDVSGDEVSLYTAEADPESSDVDELSYFPELGDGYVNRAQQEYIQKYLQMVEDVLYEGGTGYRDLMDMESAAKYWLIQAFCINRDAYHTGSTYIYKKRDAGGETGKIFWGPLWDFDYAWDHYDQGVTGFITEHNWVRPMLYDRGVGGFVELVKKYWPDLKALLEELSADGGVIDGYAKETKASAERSYLIYGYSEPLDYLKEVEDLKDWIRRRIDWFDSNIDSLDSLICKVTLMSGDEVYDNIFAAAGSPLEVRLDEMIPEKEGYVFLGWMDENGELFDQDAAITEDRILTAEFVSEDEVVLAQDIVFRRDRADIQRNFFSSSYLIPYCIFPMDAADQVVRWSSSDESYATVSPSGNVIYKGTGEVTITATLRSGKTREFVLTVSDDAPPSPTAIIPDRENIELTVGKQDFFTISTDPVIAKVDAISYESEDDTVAVVDEFGIITAVSPGETKILVSTRSWSDETCEAYVTVTVNEEAAQPQLSSETQEKAGSPVVRIIPIILIVVIAVWIIIRTSLKRKIDK